MMIDEQTLAQLATEGIVINPAHGRVDLGANQTLRDVARELFHARRTIARFQADELNTTIAVNRIMQATPPVPTRKPDVERPTRRHDIDLVEIDHLKRDVADRDRGLRQRDEQIRAWREWVKNAIDLLGAETLDDDDELRASMQRASHKCASPDRTELEAKIAELTTKLETIRKESLEHANLTGMDIAAKFTRRCADANSNSLDPNYWTTDMIAEALERGTYMDAVFAPLPDEAKTGPDTPGFTPIKPDEDDPF